MRNFLKGSFFCLAAIMVIGGSRVVFGALFYALLGNTHSAWTATAVAAVAFTASAPLLLPRFAQSGEELKLRPTLEYIMGAVVAAGVAGCIWWLYAAKSGA